MGRLIDADKLKEALHEDCMTAMGTIDESTLELLMIEIDEIPTAYDVEYEIRLLKNHINEMPKVYRKRNMNWCIARDLLMQGTSTSGKTSCITKCHELGIDPWGYELKGAAKDEQD